MIEKKEILDTIRKIIKQSITAPVDELSRTINKEVADFFDSLSDYNAIDFTLFSNYPLHSKISVSNNKEEKTGGFLFSSIPIDIDIPLYKLAEEHKLLKGKRYCFYYDMSYYEQNGDYQLDYCEIEFTNIKM